MDTTGCRPQVTKDDVAAVLRAERARADLTMEALAEKAGLSKSTIVRFESAKRAPDTDQLRALGCVFGMKVSEILASAEATALRRHSQDGRTDGPTDRPTDRPTDHSSRNARRKMSEGQLELSARSNESATDDLSPEVIEALAKSETARIIEHEQVKRDGVTKSRRRSAS